MKHITEEEFIRRYDKANSNFNNWSSLLSECYDYCMPNRNKFNKVGGNSGNNRNISLYDNTAVDANKLYASRLQQLTTPAEQDFFYVDFNRFLKKSFKAKGMTDEEILEQQIELDYITDKFHYFWEKSGATNQMNEAFLDYGIGTAAVQVNSTNNKDNPFILKSIPLFDIAIEEGSLNTIDTVFRRHNVCKKDIIILWPDYKEDSDLFKRLEPEEKVNIIEGVIFNTEDLDYDYIVYIKETKKIIYRNSYKHSPFVVTRSSVLAGETYGRGEIIDLLVDIKTLNRAQELVLLAAEKSVSEIYLSVDDSVLNADENYVIEPETILSVSDINSFKRLGYNGNPQLASIFIQERQNNIKKRLMADTIDRAKALSPQEINAIQNERSSDSLSKYARLKHEFLLPIIKRVFYIMEEQGIIKKGAFDENKHIIKFTNPLSLAENIQKSQVYLQMFSQIDNTMGAGYTDLVFHKVDMILEMADNVNIDAKYMKTKDQILKEIKQKQQEAQQQQQAAALQQQQGNK